MKDTPRHMNKLNKKVIRKTHTEPSADDGPWEKEFHKKPSGKQKKKQAKLLKKKESQEKIHYEVSDAEKNAINKHKTPKNIKNSHKIRPFKS